MASGTTGTMRSTPREGAYLADLLAKWLGWGRPGQGGNAYERPQGQGGNANLGLSGQGGNAGQPRPLFPASFGYGQDNSGGGFSDSSLRMGSAAGGLAMGGNSAGPMAPSPATQGVPGIGPLGPNASFWDDYGAGSGSFPTGGNQATAYGARGRDGVPDPYYNKPRVGVGTAGVPGVAPASSNAVAAPGYAGPSPRSYGGGSAQDYLAAILGGGGRY